MSSLNCLHGQYQSDLPIAEQAFAAPAAAQGVQLSVAHEGALIAAISGTPRFSDQELSERHKTHGAAAALLHGYRKHGRGVLQRVQGSFALALADGNKEVALLAVDRIGISSLCYAVDGSRLSFGNSADDVNALRAIAQNNAPAIEPAIEAQSIFDYLYFHMIPAPATVFQGVARLAPGYCLYFKAQQVRVEPYWQATYRETEQHSFDEWRAEFLTIVRASIQNAVKGSANVGAFLSGGTDSSTIAGMLSEISSTPVNTYSIGFDAQGFDEMEYARIAAAHFKTNHHEYYITPDDLADSIPLVAAAYDQPFGNSSALPAYYCARMAKQDGVDRMLGGDGGDELFGGNTRYAKQHVFGVYDNLPPWARGVANKIFAPEFMGVPPLIRKARSYVQQASVRMPDRLQTYNLLTRLGYADVLEPSFIKLVDTELPVVELRKEYVRCAAPSLINRMLALDLKTTLADNDLPKVVTTCELAGVSAAFPFLDDDLVAFAARLPPNYKLKGLQLRWFFKEALRGFLPDAILIKQKHGFGLPFGIWIGQHARLRDLAFGSIDQLSRRGIIQPAFAKRLTTDFLSDHATYYGEMVWVLMMLEQWIAAKHPQLQL